MASLLEGHSLSAGISTGEPEGRNSKCTLHAHAPTLPGIKIVPYSGTRKYRSICVLASRHETIFKGSEIEGARCRRLRQAQGRGRKYLLGFYAHHKALAQEA